MTLYQGRKSQRSQLDSVRASVFSRRHFGRATKDLNTQLKGSSPAGGFALPCTRLTVRSKDSFFTLSIVVCSNAKKKKKSYQYLLELLFNTLFFK